MKSLIVPLLSVQNVHITAQQFAPEVQTFSCQVRIVLVRLPAHEAKATQRTSRRCINGCLAKTLVREMTLVSDRRHLQVLRLEPLRKEHQFDFPRYFGRTIFVAMAANRIPCSHRRGQQRHCKFPPEQPCRPMPLRLS